MHMKKNWYIYIYIYIYFDAGEAKNKGFVISQNSQRLRTLLI